MKMMLIKGALAALLVALIIPAAAAAEDLSANATYKTKCAGCHGPNGEGKAAMKIEPLDTKKSEAELTEVISKGKGKMPGYEGKLTKEQIAEVAKAIKAAKK